MPDRPDTLPLELDAANCYPALQARDARFDGHWFVAVSSTGVYCRPICRVRTPQLANCRFFASAAAAEAAQYRPCLKCRPELAPRGLRWSVMDASATLASQAADLIDRAEIGSMAALARRLGISERHLLRIFAAQHGVSPQQYLQTRRLLLAKQLLTDTALPIADVASSAGFGSQRAFNTAFSKHYRLPPSELRRSRPLRASACGEPVLQLCYRPPYAIEALLEFIAARAIPGVEHVELAQAHISRSLRIEHNGRWLSGRLQLRFDRERQQLLLSPCSRLWPAIAKLVPLVRRWLDLDADPCAIDARLQAGGAIEPGLRLPGCCDRFELAVRAVLGQQVTVAAARTLASRLVQRFGEALPAGDAAPGVSHLFPAAEALASAEISTIAELGIIRQRAAALIALAQAWPQLRFARSEGSADVALAELQQLPGIGPWTAHYMLMRGWSLPDLFPPGDVVLRRQLSDAPRPREANIQALAQSRYAPYRSYAVLQLWRRAALQARKAP